MKKEKFCAIDFANMQLITKFNKGFRFLLRVIDICGKYVQIIPLKDKTSTTISNALLKMLGGLKRKPNRIWVYKANEFYIRSMKSFFQDNDIDMYSMQNEGKSVIAETCIRTLNLQIYTCMTSVSKIYWGYS